MVRDDDIEAARQAALGGDSVAVLALCAAIPELIRQRDEYLAEIVYVLENRCTDGDHAPLEAVDELRERLDELPKDKELLVLCQVGLRGYLAWDRLMQATEYGIG